MNTENIRASSRKRKWTSLGSSQGDKASKRGKRAPWRMEQDEEERLSKDARIRSLEEQNKTLKDEIENLKKQLVKEFVCPICEKSYARSDGLYSHLQTGDEAHKIFAQERYNTECDICGKKCTRWVDLKRHKMTHGQKTMGSGESVIDLDVEPDATASSSTSLFVDLTAQEITPATTNSTSTESSTPEVAWPLNSSLPLNSDDMVQSSNSATHLPTPRLKQALCFSNNPARGLGFEPSGYVNTTRFSEKIDAVQAPGFSNNPARGLDFASGPAHLPSYGDSTVTLQNQVFSNNPTLGVDITPPTYTHSPPYIDNPVVVQAPGFSNSPARGLGFATPGDLNNIIYNDKVGTVQALGFLNNPARGLGSTPPGYSYPSLYNNTTGMQAPGFSNSPARGLDLTPLGCSHTTHGNDALRTPAISDGTVRRSDLALSNNASLPLYNVGTQEAPSLGSRSFTAQQNSNFFSNSGGTRDYNATCGAQSQGTIQLTGNMQLI